MCISKTKLDKAGSILAKSSIYDETTLEADIILDSWRENHILPLTEITLKLQEWLKDFKQEYYLAQRLKRKPQIIRKLNRLSVRLSQLQDIGGCRVIFPNNNIINEFIYYISEKNKKSRYFAILKKIDYRDKGRDVSGYRAVHLILERNGYKVELQLRSSIQHYWCESIERMSVIYGKHLKENEGDTVVIEYFKMLSDAFHDIEKGIKPSTSNVIRIDNLKIQSEKIITESDTYHIFDSSVNNDFIRGMISREAGLKYQFNNWIIIFNWKSGRFINWQITERNPESAIKAYSDSEKIWPADQGYEVVMIGSSNVATIQKTHNHYFGIESYHQVLKTLDDSEIEFAMMSHIDPDARKILQRLTNRENWGQNKITIETLKNHFCMDVKDIESTIEFLIINGFVIQDKNNGALSLNIKQKEMIMRCL